ncbi:hypothetical protein [Rhizobium halophytocola]|uniref:Uncharacterized protein n=1 Tax=Rhizobium halophytocola TaxID=735519 RepID=A0ABS4E677_9HYPH|nr:hypothetical protein [Rhizobium halophytocola]MBP1853427.1 hypothetical protein [Rhizobium halophytocola]
MSFGDELFERIGTCGNEAWIDRLQNFLKQVPPAVDDIRNGRGAIRSHGWVLTFEILPRTGAGIPEDIVLQRATGDAAASMPFSLDPQGETLDSVVTKLTDNIARGSPSAIAAGDRRVSFFLENARVIELTFNEGMEGFSRILMARLGSSISALYEEAKGRPP